MTNWSVEGSSMKMQTLKIWEILVLAFSAYIYGRVMGVEITQCIHPVKDEPCNMTCKVPNFSGVIDINCNGTSRGSCITAGCGANMYRENLDTVHLQIISLSYTSDNCRWTCTYGATSSSPLTFIIYSGISGVLNLTSQESANGVKLTAIAECLYPSSPDVVVQYSEVRNGEYVSLAQQVDLQNSPTPGGCSYAIESRVTAISDVPANHADLEGKSVFFRMKFSQSPSGPDTYTSTSGPFSFKDCSLDIILCGLLPVFLIVLTVSIVFIIILKKECLPKQFGELTKKKLGIIVAFILVAIIIGVCLGLLIKGCDKKFLALGLSILFAIITVVAFILTLFFYHKKFESRKGSQGGETEDGQGQDNNGKHRSNEVEFKKTDEKSKRVGSPASASNVKMESKLH